MGGGQCGTGTSEVMPLIFTDLHVAISDTLPGGVNEDVTGPSGDVRRQHQVMIHILLNFFQAGVVFWNPQVVSIFLYKVSDGLSGH